MHLCCNKICSSMDVHPTHVIIALDKLDNFTKHINHISRPSKFAKYNIHKEYYIFPTEVPQCVN